MFRPTDEQILIMQHAIGLAMNETEYRNHFCAAPGHFDWEDLLILEKEGLMRRVHSPVPMEDDATFMVTNEGKPYCYRTRRVK